MALQNFIPTVWSARILHNLHKAHVLGNVVNRDYEGEITGYGDTVKINSIGPITASAYVKGTTTVTPAELDDFQVNLHINQAEHFAFKVDDVDKAQQKPKVMDEALREAAYALSDKADSYIAGLHTDAGLSVSNTDLKSDNVLSTIAEIGEELDKKNVSRLGRWLVLPPFGETKITLAGIIRDTDNSKHLSDKYVGRILGFDVYMSNNLKESGDNTLALAGVPRAISYAEQLLTVEPYRPQAGFSDAVKGLIVFGAKVVDANCLCKVTLKAGSESSI